jgi:type VI secretion system protein ImpA
MAYPGEEVPALNDVTKAVTAEEVREEVEAVLADAGRCRTAIATILEIWSTNAPSAPPPNVAELDNVLASLETFLKPGAGQGRKPSAGAAATNGEQKADAAAGDRSGLMQVVRSVFRPDPERAKALKIKSHAEAKAVLVRLEEYFQTKEPSSPSGLLVRQARMLVGRPLIEALEALAPAKVETMIIQVDKASGFSLGVAKIRALSASDNSEPQAWETKASASTVPVETREDVFLAIHTVEEFLFETEPSSPVPMLLSQARSFMSKDFATIMRELLEKP